MWRVPRLRFESGLLRRRGAALLIALAIETVLILLLIFLIPPAPGGKKAGGTTVFSVEATEDKADSSDTTKAKSAPRAEKAATHPPTPRPPVIPPPPVPLPERPRGPLPFIVMTREEYRESRVENMRSTPSESAPAAASASSGASHAGDSPMVGKAPNGEPLYAAEWYRRPRQVELDAYLPRRWAREGTGLIACRTVARYHVDDCKILGESPPGSGYGNAVLQAAFQFLVRPPRVGGKEMVGTWVSIRIDYNLIVK